MLKEMTLLMIVLWGSQGMPTPTPQGPGSRGLSDLYCKAVALLQKYKSVDGKSIPPESRPNLATTFSKPGCNFTKPAEECQILPAFNALFHWLQSTYSQEDLLKDVMGSIPEVIQQQETLVNYTCLDGASEKVPPITCEISSSNKTDKENKFHYIFELYRNHTQNLWRSKLTEEQRNATVAVCGTKIE